MADQDFFKLLGTDIVEINAPEDFWALLDGENKPKKFRYIPDLLGPRDPSRRTKINGKIFSKVSFTRTVIRGIEFRNCAFVDCLFIGATLDNCEFHNCTFTRTNTHKIVIVATYIDPKSFKLALDPNAHQNIGVHLYQALLNNSHDEEQPEFKADAKFEFLRWKRFQEGWEVRQSWDESQAFELVKRARILRRLVWQVLFGSGIRIRNFFATSLLTMTLVTCVNFAFREQFGIMKGDIPLTTLSEAFYFSTITLATVGYGDFVPTTEVGRIVVALEGLTGLFLFALLASMLFRKISP